MKIETLSWDGKQITTPCMIKNMPPDKYHSQCCAGPSVSSTNLRRALEVNGGSPAHFYAEWTGNPQRIEEEDKAHFILGRAVHHLMLGEAMWSEHFAIRPKIWNSWRTNDAKQWRDIQEASGKSVITGDDLIDIAGMARALARDPLVRAGSLGGQIERSIFWQDKETSLWIKIRPDAIPTDSGDFVDLKTTTAVQALDVSMAMRKCAYHQQAALIAEGARLVLGIEMSSFTFIFIEKRLPYCIRYARVEPDDIALGHKQNRAARLLIAECLRAGKFPGPGDGDIMNVSLGGTYRGYATREIDLIYQPRT